MESSSENSEDADSTSWSSDGSDGVGEGSSNGGIVFPFGKGSHWTELYWISLSLYTFLLLFTLIAYLLRLREESWNIHSLSSQVAISFFLTIFLILRIVYFGAFALATTGDWLFFVNRLALLLFFSASSVVLIRWILSLERKFSRPTGFVGKIVIISVLLNILVYGLEIGSGIAAYLRGENITSHNGDYFRTSTIFMAALNVFTATCFFFYGWRFALLIYRFKRERSKMAAYRVVVSTQDLVSTISSPASSYHASSSAMPYTLSRLVGSPSSSYPIPSTSSSSPSDTRSRLFETSSSPTPSAPTTPAHRFPSSSPPTYPVLSPPSSPSSIPLRSHSRSQDLRRSGNNSASESQALLQSSLDQDPITIASYLDPTGVKEVQDTLSREEAWSWKLTRAVIKMFFFTSIFTISFGARGVLWLYWGVSDSYVVDEESFFIISYLLAEVPSSAAAIWISRGRWKALIQKRPDSLSFTPHFVPHTHSSSPHTSALLNQPEQQVLFSD